MIKKEIASQLQRVCYELWPDLKQQADGNFFYQTIEYTKDDKFGDISSTVAMQLARVLAKNPLEIAEAIIERLSDNFKRKFGKIETALPGFLNFSFSKAWLGQQVGTIIDLDRQYGKSKYGDNAKVQVEFISANPTGPIHLGNGRGGFMGDVLSNVFASQGFQARREYYVNDIGNQVETLAESVIRRYIQQTGLNIDYPERCYQGDYVKDLAKHLKLVDVKLNDINRIKRTVKDKVLGLMLKEIQRVLREKLKIHFHRWFFESELYKKGTVKTVLAQLKEKGYVYKADGATWVKTSAFGDEKDRVLIKANRENTYFLSDIAYHYNKFCERKFERVVNFWGADHQGHVTRMQAIKKSLDWPGQLDIVVVQLVRLISNHQEVKMSKRSGTFITLEELVDDVGLDVARFFFLMRAADTHMDFDLDLAREKSDKNPVYYVQYAHARICSILKQKELKKLTWPERLKIHYDHRAEVDLITELVQYPDLLRGICESYEVQRLPFYVIKVAELFHVFYTQCRVIDQGEVNTARVALIKATQIVLRNSLKLMGVSAPMTM
ncbi:MAG: arginine--tRNA ligase [Patescibacteria group bacterium]